MKREPTLGPTHFGPDSGSNNVSGTDVEVLLGRGNTSEPKGNRDR